MRPEVIASPSSLSEQVAEIEAEIDELVEAADRCRRVAWVAIAMIAAAIGLVLALLLGLVQGTASVLTMIAAALGGPVLYGSNRSTLQETVAKMRRLESRRSELIDEINLTAVSNP